LVIESPARLSVGMKRSAAREINLIIFIRDFLIIAWDPSKKSLSGRVKECDYF
jgi:hypothetical protein